MNRRQFLTTVAAVPIAMPAVARRPNVVLILLDDLGWRDFGIYGNIDHDTPEIDRLAREGMRFTSYYSACPVCSPTRASILTGKYPARLHLTDWIPGRKQWPTSKLLVPQFEQQLNHSETSIAELLKTAGYRTASIGKWHLGGGEFLPEHHGFDVNVGGDARGGIPTFFGPFPMPGLENTTKQDYITEILTDRAVSFIESSVAAKQPFFVYLPHYTVHLPLSAREELIGKYKKRFGDKPFPNAVYAAMLESFDAELGKLRRSLDRLGVAKDTMLILTSDNGGLRYEGSSKQLITDNSPSRAGKGHLYEGGIRDPLIVSWPGVTKPNSVSDHLACSTDLLPTLCDLAGVRPPGGIDGIPLTYVLRGGKAPSRNTLFWHYPHYSNQGGVPSGAVRKGDWKLIEFYEDGRLELFNLRSDAGEQRNLAKAEPRRTSELHALLRDWRKSVNAIMPVLNPNYEATSADQRLTGGEPPTPEVLP